MNVLNKTEVSVVIVPFPAQGHLNQLLHLSHLISSSYAGRLRVHYAGSTTHIRQAKHRLHGWLLQEDDTNSSRNRIHFHDFELPPYDSPPPDPNPTSTHFPSHLLPLWNASMQLRKPVYELLQQLSAQSRRVVVIYDCLMAYVVQDVRRLVPRAESYSFVPCCAFTVFLDLYDKMGRKLPFEVDSDVITGFEIPSSDGCMTPEMKNFIDEYVTQYFGLEDGCVYNTSRVIEGEYVELYERITGKKIFAVGPFNPVEISKGGEGGMMIQSHRHECLEWLDRQEKDSVLYVSFGTMTSISDEQIEQLAIGLEKSGQKFIWVLRDADKGDVFSDAVIRRPALEEGYEERVKEKGIVIREWAPQLEILAHSSTGGFLSHCGWNSCIESISLGVPIGTWPMHSDQPRNAVFITEVLKVGTVVRDWASRGQVVGFEDVEKAVRRLVGSEEGAAIRGRAVRLGGEIRRCVAEGGSSRFELDSFIHQISS